MPQMFTLPAAAPSGGGPLPDYGRNCPSEDCPAASTFWKSQRWPVFILASIPEQEAKGSKDSSSDTTGSTDSSSSDAQGAPLRRGGQ